MSPAVAYQRCQAAESVASGLYNHAANRSKRSAESRALISSPATQLLAYPPSMPLSLDDCAEPVDDSSDPVSPRSLQAAAARFAQYTSEEPVGGWAPGAPDRYMKVGNGWSHVLSVSGQVAEGTLKRLLLAGDRGSKATEPGQTNAARHCSLRDPTLGYIHPSLQPSPMA